MCCLGQKEAYLVFARFGLDCKETKLGAIGEALGQREYDYHEEDTHCGPDAWFFHYKCFRSGFGWRGDAVAGAIIGGTLGLMLGGAANSHPVRRPPPPPRYYQTPEEIRYNASIQSRLNYLGYNAGPVDGVMGRQSRTAISDFQFEAGFRVTGRLTNEQVDVLFSADFERAHFNAPPPDAPLPVPPQDNASASDNAGMSTGEPDIVENEPIEGNEDDNRSAAEQALPAAPLRKRP